MSLLRTVLNKKVQQQPSGFDPSSHVHVKASSRSSAASFKSVATTINSISSFYSNVFGSGPQVPKRRRPDTIKLGSPEFYSSDPPAPQAIPGVELLSVEETSDLPFRAAHSRSLPNDEPYLSIVLFSHALSSWTAPLYQQQATVSGQLRLVLAKPRAIDSVDVWLVGKMDCSLEVMGRPFVQYHANLWSPLSGDPRGSSAQDQEREIPFKQRFPPGTYVFPFSFPALPEDVHVIQSEEVIRKNKGETRLPLPPSYSKSALGGFSGQIRYIVGANIKYGGFLDIDDELDFPFVYTPRTRPIPRLDAPFPLLVSREDWPLAREEVGGWTLTPFGGRGRFHDQIIEMEGILGTPSSPIFHPDATIPFMLVLYSENLEALAALADPSTVTVSFVRSEVYGPDALAPRSNARKNRSLTTLGSGSIHLVEDSSSSLGEDDRSEISFSHEDVRASRGGAPPVVPEDPSSEFTVEATVSQEALVGALDESSPLNSPMPHRSSAAKRPRASRWVSYTPTTGTQTLDNDEASPVPIMKETVSRGRSQDEDPDDKLDLVAPSPTPSIHSDKDEDEPLPRDEYSERTIKLRGEVPVVGVNGLPSFKYKYMSREYLVKLVISHNDYSHISPSGPGIYSEAPIWVVTDPPRSSSDSPRGPSSSVSSFTSSADIPITGPVVPLTEDAHIAKEIVGVKSVKSRPLVTHSRLSAF